jgi:hypothetical protein
MILFIIIFEVILISKGNWNGDFWEHSAVVNELSKNFFHPNNPIIKSEIPHAFFSPYSIFVALFSKITNLNAIQSLECFAFFNLIFFLISYHLFCKTFFKDNYIIVAPLSLFFILVFWGEGPFMWSGFLYILIEKYTTFHLKSIPLISANLLLWDLLSNTKRDDEYGYKTRDHETLFSGG